MSNSSPSVVNDVLIILAVTSLLIALLILVFGKVGAFMVGMILAPCASGACFIGLTVAIGKLTKTL